MPPRNHANRNRRVRDTDVFVQNRLCVRLREKGAKAHAMPCHHNLEEYLLSFSVPRRPLTCTAMHQADAHDMIRRRARAAGVATAIGNRKAGWPCDMDVKLQRSRTALRSLQC
jgi:hypothetical protein